MNALFAVIDTSGSMDTACSGASDPGCALFSRLDLVKHTLNTITSALAPDDLFCIVTFNTSASVFLAPTRAEHLSAIRERIASLRANGNTNIWDGMRVAIDEIAKLTPADQTRNVQLYLLTDGVPNMHPPKPIHETVATYMRAALPAEMMRTRPPVINTFGYGTELDSQLLFSLLAGASAPPHPTGGSGALDGASMLEVATMRWWTGRRITSTDASTACATGGCGGAGSPTVSPTGIFGFIPDASMVGTVFINALATSLLHGAAEETKEHVSPIMRSACADVARALQQLARPAPASTPAAAAIGLELRQAVQQQKLLLATHGLSDRDRAFLGDLLADCMPNTDPARGQLAKALEPAYYNKWGVHYLRSVLSAFDRLVCINFKDRAMQHLRSARFIAQQTRIETLFLTLPPPTPTAPASTPRATFSLASSITSSTARIRSGGGMRASLYDSSSSSVPKSREKMVGRCFSAASTADTESCFLPSSPPPPQPFSMRNFLDPSGGCFSGDTMVPVMVKGQEEGRRVPFSVLRPGMLVRSARGVTTVETVVRLGYSGDLYSVASNVRATPYHPMVAAAGVDEEDGFFPKDNARAAVVFEPATFVYDVVLANRSLLQLGDDSDDDADGKLLVATWGHRERQRDPVFAHAFFGSEAVIRALARHPDYASGYVTLAQPIWIRDEESTRVVDLRWS